MVIFTPALLIIEYHSSTIIAEKIKFNTSYAFTKIIL